MVGARWAVFGDKRGVGSDQNKWGWGDQGALTWLTSFLEAGQDYRVTLRRKLEEDGQATTLAEKVRKDLSSEWADYLKS